MTWEEWVSIAALVLATVAVIVGLVLLRRLSEARRGVKPLTAKPAGEPPPDGPPAFVINPAKVPDPIGLRRLAAEAAQLHGLDVPLWFETTKGDPGLGQAKEALEQGASLVVAAGGDGTVRAVAEALSGTRVPMGLIPMGTGNLLARNLDLPLGDLRGLVDTALTGHDYAIDVGYLRAEGPQGQAPGESGQAEPYDQGPDATKEHVFLVMAGLGFDAAMVAGADNELKKRVGWLAYFVAGAKHLHSRRLRVRMTLDRDQTIGLRLRSLLFANCGRLPGGIVLLPDAEIDDGMLDIAGIDTRGGVIGWASLFGKVILQGLGVRRELPASPGSIEFWRGREVEVATESPEPVQVDGDLVGKAVRVHVTVRQASLHVRTR